MRQVLEKLLFISVALMFGGTGRYRAAQSSGDFRTAHLPAEDYPFKPLPCTAVHLNDVFWAPRIETNRTVTILFAFEQREKSGRMDNFVRAAEVLRGENPSDRRCLPILSITPTRTRCSKALLTRSRHNQIPR